MENKPTVTDMMVAYAQDAVDHAQLSLGVVLDYSLGSVKSVEDILEKLHAALPRSFRGKLYGKGPTQQDIDKVCKMYGGYIGEVFRRAGGGEWFLDTEIVHGWNTIGLRKGDQRIWPVSKVQKRITNGSEDNVWAYCQVAIGGWK